MGRAKREYEGGLVGWLAAHLIAFMPFTGKSLSPAALNPYGSQDPGAAERIAAVRRHIAAIGIGVRARESAGLTDTQEGGGGEQRRD